MCVCTHVEKNQKYLVTIQCFFRELASVASVANLTIFSLPLFMSNTIDLPTPKFLAIVVKDKSQSKFQASSALPVSFFWKNWNP